MQRLLVHSWLLLLPLVGCAEDPRLRVEVHTDLGDVGQDFLMARVQVDGVRKEADAVLVGDEPHVFSIQSKAGGAAELYIEVRRMGETLRSATFTVALPTEGETCVAVHLRANDRSEMSDCDAVPIDADGGTTKDGGTLDAAPVDGGDAGPTVDAGDVDGGTSDGGLFNPFAFPVKNVDPAVLIYEDVGNVGAAEVCTFDSGPLTFSPVGCLNPGIEVVDQPGGQQLAVLSFQSLVVAGQLNLVGPRPVAFLAANNIVVSGLLDGSAHAEVSGPGGADCVGGDAPLDEPDCDAGGGGGGGGGVHAGGTGGQGDSLGCTGGAAGTVRHASALVPLTGGCRGGAGAIKDLVGPIGGGGGGGLQLVANDVTVTGTLLLGGGGGAAGFESTVTGFSGGGGGGGGGGALLVQAGRVLLNVATIDARGGGGGGGDENGDNQSGDPGEDAADGAGGGQGAGDGGAGGRNDTPDDGSNGPIMDGGGGGGGSTGLLLFEAEECIKQNSSVRPNEVGC